MKKLTISKSQNDFSAHLWLQAAFLRLPTGTDGEWRAWGGGGGGGGNVREKGKAIRLSTYHVNGAESC